MTPARQAILTADDFGASLAVNEAVERAHRAGILTAASLMVATPAAADAIGRAKRNPGLRVGLHLVLVAGPASLPAEQIPSLVGPGREFSAAQVTQSLRYALPGRIRRELAAEIRAQFAAFAETGLHLDHADAHKHMHLHPVIGALMLEVGREFGLAAVRVPEEPAAVLAACGEQVAMGARLLALWTRVFRAQARRAGMVTNDSCFGLTWSGAMTEERLLRLIPRLPPGLAEIYFHPGADQPSGQTDGSELAALISPRAAQALEEAGVVRTSYGAAVESLY